MSRDDCATKFSSLRKDDVIVVGRTRWRVWKNIGVTNFVTKDGSKGKKLYTLEVTALSPCCLAVREVGGSGQILADKKPVAIGCSRNGAATWNGPRRRR